MDRPKLANGRGSTSLIWIIVAGLAIIVGGLLIATLTPYILPTQGSAEAQQIDNLFRFLLALGGMVFLLVQGVIAFSVIRFRAKTNEIADGPPIHGNTTLEFVWTVIPAIIVTLITIYAYSVFTSIRAPKPGELVVEATGQRFAWSFRYTVAADELPAEVDQDTLIDRVKADLEEDGEISFNYPQLATWVGQPMQMLLQSEDVIHSFWIPGMRIKQDLLPGRVTDIRFTPIEAGVYRITCAELCGTGHGNMAGTVVDRFDPETGQFVQDLEGAWLIVYPDEETYRQEFYMPELYKVLFPPADPALYGRQLLSSGEYPCQTCHRLDDLGWTGTLGPPLNGVASRTQRLAATGATTMQDYLRNSLANPTSYVVPGYNPIMPDLFDESDPDQETNLEAIVAYLFTQTGEQ